LRGETKFGLTPSGFTALTAFSLELLNIDAKFALHSREVVDDAGADKYSATIEAEARTT